MTRTRAATLRIFALAGLLCFSGTTVGQDSGDQLERGFKEPPDSAKPRVWWHWMSGNVTKEGITADLEWMKRVGVAGMQLFDGSLGIPQFTDKRLVWMTPEWKDAFHHAAAEADRLGLEMSMAASGGWSETAGPWVKPEQGMKKVVWSEKRLQGPRSFAGALPNPPSMNGRFQNIPVPKGLDVPEMTDLPGAKPAQKAPPASPDPTYYADIAVMAYRVPDDELRMVDLHPKATSSAGGIDAAALMDGDFGKTIALSIAEGAKNAWIQFEFAQPFRAQAFSIAIGSTGFFGGGIPDGEVQASQNGTDWITLVSLPGQKHLFGGFPVRTYSFPETTASFYRVLFFQARPDPTLAMFGFGPAHQFNIAEIELLSNPRVNLWEEKASFGTLLEAQSAATPAVPTNQAIARNNVIDLSSKMRKDGTLDWDVPAGNWVVVRMGYSLTGG